MSAIQILSSITGTAYLYHSNWAVVPGLTPGPAWMHRLQTSPPPPPHPDPPTLLPGISDLVHRDTRYNQLLFTQSTCLQTARLQ